MDWLMYAIYDGVSDVFPINLIIKAIWSSMESYNTVIKIHCFLLIKILSSTIRIDKYEC